MTNNQLPHNVNDRMVSISKDLIKLGSIINVPMDWIPPIEDKYTDAPTSVVCKQDKTEFVHSERGRDTVKISTNDRFELLYVVLDYFVNGITGRHIVDNRKEPGENPERQDPRRGIYKKKRELFELLGGDYLRRYDVEERKILSAKPYVD